MFETRTIKSSLCDYLVAYYILVTCYTTVNERNNTDIAF